MDRMTHERVNGIRAGYWSPEKKEELVQRLAAYENIGLEPEEISAKVAACNIYKSLGLTPDQIQELKLKEDNDGWIPVEKEWPPFGQRLQATILHHEWTADYDSYWVPEEEKTYHTAYMEVCEIYPMGEMWCYSCEEDKYEKDIAYINPAKVLSRPVAEIIAWRLLPEPYKPERSVKE